MQITALIIACLLPQTALPVRNVSVAEINRVIRPGDDEPRFEQLVLWGPYPGEHNCFVREWLTLEEYTVDVKANLLIHDGKIYKCRAMYETWSSYDTEVEDRWKFPYGERIKVQ